MRAVIYREHSPSLEAYEVVHDFPTPTPGPDQVLIQVQYAALNRLDDWVRIGWKGLNLQFPHIPCSDFVGTVAGLGSDVTGWQMGQRVTANPTIWCGKCRFCLAGQQNRCQSWGVIGEQMRGACAEFICMPAVNLLPVPAEYDLQKAAAASLVYTTAWHNLLTAGNLRAGERVLIVGAGGGVNTAAMQIAKLTGATVYVIASSAAKAQLAREQGADWVHDRSADANWAKALFAATQREGVDMVVDNVGQATMATSLRTLCTGGRLVTVGGTSGYEVALPLSLIFWKHLSIIGSTMGTQADYEQVMRLVFAGKLNPIVDSVYPMSDFCAAIARMMADEQFGKIVIKI